MMKRKIYLLATVFLAICLSMFYLGYYHQQVYDAMEKDFFTFLAYALFCISLFVCAHQSDKINWLRKLSDRVTDENEDLYRQISNLKKKLNRKKK